MRSLQLLWNIDPGYFRLKHAAKTIVAILITLAILHGNDLVYQLMGVVAKSFVSRIKQIFLLNSAYFLVFMLGLVVRDSANWSAILLVVVGFFANYVRRFGLQNSVAPMMGWTLCFFAIILPFSSTSVVWAHIYWLIVALLVSALVNGLIFPDNYPRLFVSNSNRLFNLLGQGMHELRRHVLHMEKVSSFNPQIFAQITDTLHRLLESNQSMDESEVFSETSASNGDDISRILLQQYALVHAYIMMLDAYNNWSKHPCQLPRAACIRLSGSYKRFECLFTSIKMNDDFSIDSNKDCIVSLATSLQYIPPSDPAIIIVMLNIKLSFNLLNRHVMQLIRGTDET